jgi:hypothetical protein
MENPEAVTMAEASPTHLPLEWNAQWMDRFEGGVKVE